MKTITVTKQFTENKEQDDKWVGKPPTKNDAEIYKGKESLKVLREDGSVLCVILRGVMPKEVTLQYLKAVTTKGAIKKTDLRGMASGLETINKTKKDGTISNTSRTDGFVESSIIGYYDRYPRINYCRKTAWTQKNPAEWNTVEDYTKIVDDCYKDAAPDDYKRHREISSGTSPDFVIGDTCFTTITLNRNFRTHYHRDAGNLREGLAAMSYMKTGKFSGGHVVFPNYKIGVALNNFDLIVFDNLEIHGNTPIVAVSEKYQRITSVFFYRENMVYCGTIEDELDRAKRNNGDGLIGPTSEDLNKGRWRCMEQ